MKSIEITLPGLQKKTEIRNLKVKEVDIMTNRAKMSTGEGLDALLDSCMLTKVGVDSSRMIDGDRNSIMMAVRRATFGDDFDFNANCPHCNETDTYTVDLSKFENVVGDQEFIKKTYEWIAKDATLADKSDEKKAHKELEPLFPVELSEGKKIYFRLETASDHKKLIKGLKSNAGKTATLKLLLKIKKAEGLPQGAPIKAWIPEMDWDDLETFNDAYTKVAPYLDDKIILTCENGLCGEEFETRLEIKTDTFFKRSSRKKTS
ncbi:MAG: hypothetical protein V3T43_02880 [Nitrosomonadaceae bacterium]